MEELTKIVKETIHTIIIDEAGNVIEDNTLTQNVRVEKIRTDKGVQFEYEITESNERYGYLSAGKNSPIAHYFIQGSHIGVDVNEKTYKAKVHSSQVGRIDGLTNAFRDNDVVAGQIYVVDLQDNKIRMKLAEENNMILEEKGIKKFRRKDGYYILKNKEGQCGCYDSISNRMTIPFGTFDEIKLSSYENGTFHVKKGNSWGIASVHGQLLIPVMYSMIRDNYSSGFSRSGICVWVEAQIKELTDLNWFYIDRENMVVPADEPAMEYINRHLQKNGYSKTYKQSKKRTVKIWDDIYVYRNIDGEYAIGRAKRDGKVVAISKFGEFEKIDTRNIGLDPDKQEITLSKDGILRTVNVKDIASNMNKIRDDFKGAITTAKPVQDKDSEFDWSYTDERYPVETRNGSKSDVFKYTATEGNLKYGIITTGKNSIIAQKYPPGRSLTLKIGECEYSVKMHSSVAGRIDRVTKVFKNHNINIGDTYKFILSENYVELIRL